jgi:hypothetical protein
MLVKILAEQLNKAKQQLIDKVSRHIEFAFTTAATTAITPTTPTISTTTEGDGVVRGEMTVQEIVRENRSLAHCLRALILINQGHIAEDILAKQVITPQLK